MSDLHYTVGKDSSGSTVLKVGSDFVTTLTIASVNIDYGDDNDV